MKSINEKAHYLATRLCHDLTGPISAVNNGVELLEDEEMDMREDALALIASSAKEAVTRLQFYRMAYGHVPEGGEVELIKQRELIDAFFGAQKITLDWQAHGQPTLSYAERALVLNLLMLAAKPLIRGGGIVIEDASTAGAANVTLNATGQSIRLEDELLAQLNGETPVAADDPKGVQIAMSLELAEVLGGVLHAKRQDESCWQLHYTCAE